MIELSNDSNAIFAAKLGPNHGYSIEGDLAQLYAEVEVAREASAGRQWALQLWACDAPHAGGPLSGVKIAEAAVPAQAEAALPLRLDAEALARVPGGERDYAMVLVLASGEAGSFTQVHDFANYPARQRFITPHLEGSVGYRLDGDDVVISVERIRNPRRGGNLSGSLALELWALAAPYRGGAFEGYRLSVLELGQLADESVLEGTTGKVAFDAPPAGSWQVALMLREWAGPLGYVTRDFASFEVAYVVSEKVAPVEAEPVVAKVAEPVVAKAEPQPAAAPVAPNAVSDEPVRVSIMRASLSELAAVKGLNRKLASEIIKARPFTSVEQLTRVRGIGPKSLAGLRKLVTL